MMSYSFIPALQVGALLSTRPNKLVRTYFLYNGELKDGELNFVLIIKDVQSSYAWIWFCINAHSDSVNQDFLEWIVVLFIL